MEQLTKNQAVATSQEAVQNQNEPQLRDENAHNDKSVHGVRRFKIVVIDIQITLKQMLRDFIGIRVNRAKKSGMVNITSSVNSRERSGINTILHELNPLFTINVTMRDIKS